MIAVVLSLLTTVYGMDNAWKSSLRNYGSPKQTEKVLEIKSKVREVKSKLPASSKIKVQPNQLRNTSVIKKELRVVKNNGEKIAGFIYNSSNVKEIMDKVKKKFPYHFGPKELKGIEKMVREEFEKYNRGIRNEIEEENARNEVLSNIPVEDLWNPQSRHNTPENKKLGHIPEESKEESSPTDSLSNYTFRELSEDLNQSEEKTPENSSENDSEYNFEPKNIQFPAVNNLYRIKEYERFQENYDNNSWSLNNFRPTIVQPYEESSPQVLQYTFEISGQDLWAEDLKSLDLYCYEALEFPIVQRYETPEKHMEDSRKEIIVPVFLGNATNNGQLQYVVDWSRCLEAKRQYLLQSDKNTPFKVYLSSQEIIAFSNKESLKRLWDIPSARKN